MYIDWTYIVLIMPAVIFSLWAREKVNSTFRKYSVQVPSRRMTGYDAARTVLDSNGLHNVKIERIRGDLTDHYDPKTNTIRLSDSVYDSASTAAIGVAAHEAGHAIQYAEGYVPVKIRSAIVPITNFGARLSMPLILIGLLFSSYGAQYVYIAYAGVICFAMVTVFQLVTLPTEFNASRRAVAALEGWGMLTDEEIEGSKKVLSAAALTYVAALAVSFMQLLRLILIFSGRSRRRR
jgi:Zn-dependent membrane protease YugP